MGSRWGRDLELSIPCGTLNTGAVRFVFKLSDGTRFEEKWVFKGDPNVNHAPMTLAEISGYRVPYPIYRHRADQSVELLCGFSIEEYID
jgi:hypothetical protein